VVVHRSAILAPVAGQRKQKTRPKDGKPTGIRVPRRRDVMDALKRAALRRTSTSK